MRESIAYCVNSKEPLSPLRLCGEPINIFASFAFSTRLSRFTHHVSRITFHASRFTHHVSPLSLTGRFGKITTMSTPPKRDSKAAAKRRAETRRRNRDIGRHLFAYGVIAILVISTVSTVLIPSAGAPTPTPTPVLTVNTPASQGLDQLLTQAKAAEDKGDWATAVGLYQAYLASQSTPSADVQLKLAKALINGSPPDYVKASASLQQAISTAGQGSAIATEAQQLLADNASKIATAEAMPTATATVGATITGTATLSTTSVPLTSVTAAPTGIGPVPVVPTSSTPGSSTGSGTATSAPGTPGASPTR
jgi:hypothetical protein